MARAWRLRGELSHWSVGTLFTKPSQRIVSGSLCRRHPPLSHPHELARIFGSERWEELAKKLGEDDPAPISLEALYTSGFIDDPRDRRRTLSNMELSLLHYLTRYPEGYLPYVEGDFVGIEVPSDLKLTFEDGIEFAYLGRADVILTEPKTGKLIVVDNKTSSNVSNQWETQWRTSHQLTGYCVGVSSMMPKRRVMDFGVLGLQVPLPKGQEFGGYVFMKGPRPTGQC
jgi:hypothetical protein